MLRDPFFQPSIAQPPTTSQSSSRRLEALESSHHGGVKMDDFLLLQWKLEDFVVVARYGNLRRRPFDGDQLRSRRKLETVRQRRQALGDLGVRLVACKPCLLPHRILELIEMEIGFAKIHREVGGQGEDQERKQTP